MSGHNMRMERAGRTERKREGEGSRDELCVGSFSRNVNMISE